MRPGDELGTVIAGFLADAEAGRAGRPYPREELRELRGALSHVESELGTRPLDAVRGEDVGALVDSLRDAGLPPGRTIAIVDALRSVYAYAIERGLVSASPLVGLAPPSPAPRSPTDAMLELGEQVAAWTVRLIVTAFVLIAVGLVIVLA